MRTVTYARFSSPLGILTGVSQHGAVANLWLPGQQFTLPPHALAMATPELTALGGWLERYFSGEDPTVDFPISPEGTAFRQRVWALLRTIPYGCSTTYGQLAQKISPSMSSQAIGQAVGKNPIPIVIPCHRVLGADGSLTGYSGGLSAKMHLLKLEGISYR